MQIAISGATGLLGSAITRHLEREGHRLLRLQRPQSRPSSSLPVISFDPSSGSVDLDALRDMDAVVHLAGAGIADKRWTPQRKRVILDSRISGTETLARALAEVQPRGPRVMLSASAIGYYGDRSLHCALDESAPAGEGFLPEVCKAWEAATAPAEAEGLRVVHMRFGVVLSPKGGALKKMLPLFKLGLGGKLGKGTQPMSWISITDIGPIVSHLLSDDTIRGAVNLCAPHALSNREFVGTLARVLKRPALIPAPGFALKLAFGEMAEEALLSGANASPAKLVASGYEFKHPELEQAIRELVK